MDTGNIRATEDEALQFHSSGRPGKLSSGAALRFVKPVKERRGCDRRV